jgi:hypothetical protein
MPFHQGRLAWPNFVVGILPGLKRMTAQSPAPRSTFIRQGIRAALPFAVYLTLIAATLAYLEVQIEVPHGWAANLPTWRVRDLRLTWLFGGRPMTGYHVGLNLLLQLLFLQSLYLFHHLLSRRLYFSCTNQTSTTVRPVQPHARENQ